MPKVYSSVQGDEALQVVEASGGSALLVPIDLPNGAGLLAARLPIAFTMTGDPEGWPEGVTYSADVEVLLTNQTVIGAFYETPDPDNTGLMFGPLTIASAEGPGTALVRGSVINVTGAAIPATDPQQFTVVVIASTDLPIPPA